MDQYPGIEEYQHGYGIYLNDKDGRGYDESTRSDKLTSCGKCGGFKQNYQCRPTPENACDTRAYPACGRGFDHPHKEINYVPTPMPEPKLNYYQREPFSMDTKGSLPEAKASFSIPGNINISTNISTKEILIFMVILLATLLVISLLNEKSPSHDMVETLKFISMCRSKGIDI
jgi:hypothetical protein